MNPKALQRLMPNCQESNQRRHWVSVFDIIALDGRGTFQPRARRNRPEVLRIFNKYGWVTNSLAGKDAAHDFWLLIQHQTLEIQRRLLPALEKAAGTGNAAMSDYAYLHDRVQVGLGRPQHWGTQTSCENGKPALAPVDDPAGLDARGKELYMLPIDKYLKNDYLARSCAGSGKK